MRLFSWNVNGVRAIEKKGFLDWVDNISPDILCIQETKANFDQLPDSLQNIHGYHGYWHSGERKGYSGVATFCKNEPLDVQYGLGIEKYDKLGYRLPDNANDLSEIGKVPGNKKVGVFERKAPYSFGWDWGT